jgi:predicted permease
VAGGLLLALAFVELVPGWVFPPQMDPPPVVLDHRVAAFAVAAGAASALIAGLLPAVLVSRSRLADVLKGSAGTGTARRGRLRSALTVAQIAVSLGLVVAALLLDRTVRNLSRIDLGYDPEGIVLVRLDPEPLGYEPARAAALRMDLLRLAAELPGAEAVGGADEGPLAVHFVTNLRSTDDVSDAWPVEAWRDHVTPGYFGSLGVPVIHGRTFTNPELARSFEAPPAAAVVSETLALRLFGGTDVVGRTLVQRGYQRNDMLEVVGVVADHRVRSLEGPPEAILYLPLGSGYSRGMVLTLRTSRPAASVVEDVRGLMDRLDPTLPFYEAGRLESRVLLETFDRRLLQRLIGFLAILAALLAGVGLYGVVAHSVAERAREIGIRMALGAQKVAVVGGIVRQSLTLVGFGVVAGAGIAWALVRLVGQWLYGVTPLDVGVWLPTAVVFLILGILAAAGPARYAARLDPMKTIADST